jgi:gliding motility-associated-like protein
MKTKSYAYLIFFTLFSLLAPFASGQITAPGATGTAQTEYPGFNETDNIYVFCVTSEIELAATLQATTLLEGTKTFLWEQYNNQTGEFELYFSESAEATQSEISGLADGGYRVTITQGETTELYRAWVFNNWFTANASIPDSLSDCESFTLKGSFLSAPLIYYDLQDNAEIEIFKDVQVEWKEGQATIASVLSPQIFNPPAANTDYTFRVYDRFGCETTAKVTYESIVTKAAFSVDPQSGEAPLTVTFTNLSENGDPNLYEWFFYRDLDEIKREAENTDQPIDSIDFVAYDQNPVYTFENSGTYNVKLVSKHQSGFHVCADTAYIEEFIIVDTSFVAVPNVFTPNGDGTNDVFAVKYWSMQSIKISIFNRWGKRIHFWENNDVQGFEGTYTEAVWDGRIGGRYASPGVYYYVVEGMGRDGKKRPAHGFFHLFREKD